MRRRRRLKGQRQEAAGGGVTAAPESPVRIEVAWYSEAQCVRQEGLTPAQAFALCDSSPGGVKWLNVFGVHDVPLVEAIGKRFEMHPLVVEDVLHTSQRPKVDTYAGQIYVVAHMLSLDAARGDVLSEQVSFVLGAGWLVLFQENPGDVFASVRQRVDKAGTRVRSLGADYLLYALLDAIVDGYFVVLERVGERLEEIEEEIVDRPRHELLPVLHGLRKELLLLRRAIWPLRDAISALQHAETPLIAAGTGLFLRDVYDHTVRLIDTVETHREIAGGLYEIYMSGVSNRMNEVMKVLTVIATIFIPLTFIAGIYGMNFERMPELHHPWGYPAVLALMALVALGMLAYFRRQRWL